MLRQIALLAAASFALSACQDQASGGQSGTRSEIRIVGSSTVFPFAKAVAEQYSINGANPSPILESTGTGSGLSLFCSGVGANTPDIVNASRRIKRSELELCQTNGVTDVVEVQIGIDGIAIAQSKNGPSFSLTPAQIYKAIAARPFGIENSTESWSEIDPSLPDLPINVYGPPSTSGTRDALTELIMEVGCITDPATRALKDSDEEEFKSICHEIRADGAYIDAGENDNLIVQKLTANPNSVGIFGYSFLEANLDNVRGIAISGVEPGYEAIASGDYPGARPLYVYAKKQHVGVIPGLQDYLLAFVNAGTRDGYLAKAGLIVSPDNVRENMTEVVRNMTPLAIGELK
ncbi:substrate-binding domain-containing protein [Parasphingorhabdus sp.]|uniref:substrate-binding domain-containing protein n=1 Tax=Parasphingorhabdus sp. TaxID=2709688 RepID=UPI00359309CC